MTENFSTETTIVWVGRFSSTTGYAAMTRTFNKVLTFSNINTVFVDIDTLNLVGKPHKSHIKFRSDTNGVILESVSEKENVLLIINDTPGEYHRFESSGRVRQIGYTMFETLHIPSGWLEPMLLMDEIWVPSQFNRETFSNSNLPNSMINVMPLALDTKSFPSVNKMIFPSTNSFKFLTILSGIGRKDIGLLLRAYFTAFRGNDDVSLIIKVSNAVNMEDLITRINNDLFPTFNLSSRELPHVLFVRGEYSDERMAELYNSVDTYVSTERGKGWDLPSMEAMASGVPVINTAWGGNTEFMNEKNSYLVVPLDNYVHCAPNLITNPTLYTGQMWPTVSVDRYATALKRMYSDPEIRSRLGKAGMESIKTNFTLDATAERIKEYIKRLNMYDFRSNRKANIRIAGKNASTANSDGRSAGFHKTWYSLKLGSNGKNYFDDKSVDYETACNQFPDLKMPYNENASIDEWIQQRRKIWAHFGSVRPPTREQCRLESRKNAYLGEDIFILGNGPSLAKFDIDVLDDYYTFAANRINVMFDRTDWRPDFYTCLDWRVVPDNYKEINKLRGMEFFFPERFRGLLRNGEDVYWYNSRSAGKSLLEKFEPDLTRGARGGGTIITAAIQIAYYLGFRRIFLIGIDASYKIPESVQQSGKDQFGTGIKLLLESTKDDDFNHFDPRYFGKGKKWHDPNVDEMVRGFINMRRYLEMHNALIYNATIGGALEVLERIDFDEALKIAGKKTKNAK